MTTRWRDPETGRTWGADPGTADGKVLTRWAPASPDEQALVSPPIAKVEPEDVSDLKAAIRELSRGERAGDPACAPQLRAIRDAEYGRTDGGRTEIKRALASAGYGRP